MLGMLLDFDLDIIFETKGAKDYIFIGKRVCFFGGKLSGLKHMVQKGVVLGNLCKVAFAQAIDPAISHVCKEEVFITGVEYCGNGCSHAFIFWMFARFDKDAFIGILDRARKSIAFWGSLGDFGVGPFVVGLFGQDAGKFGDMAYGQSTRELSRSVPTHAIGNDVESFPRNEDEIVLILFACSTDISHAKGA